jgi:hypothetical protein
MMRLSAFFIAWREQMPTKAVSAALVSAFLLFGAAGQAHAVTVNADATIQDSNLFNNTADGPTYNLSDGPFSWGALFDTIDAAGKATFQFKNDTSSTEVITTAITTILQGVGGFFKDGVSASWIGGDTDSIGQNKSGVIEIAKQLMAGEVATLQISFGNPKAVGNGRPGIQLQVGAASAVPVPPALLLMLTALGGVGFLARRKAKAQV